MTNLIPTSKLLARKKMFSFMGDEFEILDPNGELKFFVKQKAFKLKEAITVSDHTKSNPVLFIKARSWMDFSGTYDVTDPSGQKFGALKRDGVSSMFRDKWIIFDAQDNAVGTVEEDSMLAAMIRRFLTNIIPQRYDITIDGQLIAEFDQHFNPFIAKFDLDFTKNASGALSPEMGIAIAVLLLAIEGRQN